MCFDLFPWTLAVILFYTACKPRLRRQEKQTWNKWNKQQENKQENNNSTVTQKRVEKETEDALLLRMCVHESITQHIRAKSVHGQMSVLNKKTTDDFVGISFLPEFDDWLSGVYSGCYVLDTWRTGLRMRLLHNELLITLSLTVTLSQKPSLRTRQSDVRFLAKLWKDF